MQKIIKIDPSLSLKDLADNVGSTPQAVWEILCGATTQDYSLACALARQCYCFPKTLMFHRNKQIRHGVLIWVQAYTGIHKQSLCRYFKGLHVPKGKRRNVLAHFTGMSVQEFEICNWFINK